jgi:hypothetical protein
MPSRLLGSVAGDTSHDLSDQGLGIVHAVANQATNGLLTANVSPYCQLDERFSRVRRVDGGQEFEEWKAVGL